MKLPALLLTCAVLVGCSPEDPAAENARQEAERTEAAVEAASEAREDFLSLDFDGRWGWYRREVRDAEEESRWAQWFAETGESEFLEWLALTRPERWSVYGRALVERDDPRWVRLAVWSQASTVAVDVAAAKAAIAARPGLVLDWLERHLDRLSPEAVTLREELVAEAPEREDASGFLAPLSNASVYAGLLREAHAVHDGTATAAPIEEDPARGDVPRAILALRLDGGRSPRLLDALSQVAMHPDATLAMAVAQVSLSLSTDEVPTMSLLVVARDRERPVALREAALEAIAHGPRYAAYIELCKIVLSPRHDLWPAAVRHLGQLGGKLAGSFLNELTDEELDEEQRALRDAALAAISQRGEMTDDQFTEQLTDFLELMTYADLAGGLIRDKALGELREELCAHAHSYELKYKVKTVMVKYKAPARLAIGLDGDLWTARLREHCSDAIEC